MATISAISQGVSTCRACPLRSGCRRPVPGCGNAESPIMIIGEAPGRSEDRHGKPFIGPSGRELDVYLSKAGLSRQACYITNVVKCRPEDDRDPLPLEQTICYQEHLRKELEITQPLVIVTLGQIASNTLLGPVDMNTIHGIPQYQDGRVIVPMHHPAYAMHNTTEMYNLISDFRMVARVLTGEASPENFLDRIPDPMYKILEGHQVGQWTSRKSGHNVYCDTETCSDGSPLFVQFAFCPGHGFLVRASDRIGVGYIRTMLQDPDNTTVLHNAKFDVQVLRRMGINPAHIDDSMVAAYVLGDVPRGLKALAYCTSGMLMKSYPDMVRKATEERFRQYFQEVASHDWPDPEPQLEWDSKPRMDKVWNERWIGCTDRKAGCQQCPVCGGIGLGCPICNGTGYAWFKRTSMERIQAPGTDGGHWRVKRPQPIRTRMLRALDDLDKNPGLDLSVRWSNIENSTQEAIREKLGRLLPCDLSDIDLRDAIWYSCRDADATARVWPSLWARIKDEGMEDAYRIDMGVLEMVIDMERIGMGIDKSKFASLSKYYDKEMNKSRAAIDRELGISINPGSDKKVSEALYDRLRLRCNSKTKSGGRSVDNEALTRLMTVHPVVPHIQRYRELFKAQCSFAKTLPAKAGKDGRIHPDIKSTSVKTGRLATANPNLMAIPVRSEEGKKIRECFVSNSGNSLVTGDYSQIEMRLVGHVSQDAEMLRIFRAKEDIHAITASRIFGLPVDRLDDMLHRYPAKRVGFGVLNHLTPEGLLDQLMLSGCEGWDLKQCADLIKEWFSIFSGVKKYFGIVKAEARRSGRVRDLFGRSYLVPEVYSSIPWIREAGERQACSYIIQGGAQGIMKRAMVAVRPLYQEFIRRNRFVWPLIQIHDDVVWEVEDGVIPVFIPSLRAVMTGAVQLSIPLDVDIKTGKDWGTMKKPEEGKTNGKGN